MYSRSYFRDTDVQPTPPENYSGTALAEEACEREENGRDAVASVMTEESQSDNENTESVSVFSSLFRGESPITRLFSGGGIKSFISGIGTEEILIIAAAALLFFSKEGDRECAVMLLILLFI
ncbi:MAG: hypothetical protein IKB38_04570 [Clostridia bacterium]|nr:hypothetical protein [Clostridia bacterium]